MERVTRAARNIDPVRYRRLLSRTMPVVIESEGENARILAIVEKLMNKGEKLSAEEGKLLKLLTRLVQDFEERLYKRSEATPVEVFVTSWKLAT